MDNNRITLAEYAALVGRDKSRAMRKAQNGDFPSAKLEQLGKFSIWMIDRDELWTDRRTQAADAENNIKR